MRHLDLFSGIGGFALAAHWVGGIETTQFVEIDTFCQKVLAKNFPGVPIHGDIRTFTASAGDYDIITGGFPCQPHSLAGKKLASKDSRDLWPELYRIICAVRPKGIVLENVPGLLSSESGRFFRGVLWDLAKAGYDAEWAIISCADLGGSHKRERVWIVAYPRSIRYSEQKARKADRNFKRNNSTQKQAGWPVLHEVVSSGSASPNIDSNGLEARQWETTGESPISQLKRFNGNSDRKFTAEPTICRGDDGIQEKLDANSGESRMDKYLVISEALKQNRLMCDPETGAIYSLVQRGKLGTKTQLKGTKINGYTVYKIYFEGRKYMIKGHQVVWFASNGAVPEGMQIDHINRDRSDNRIQNLRLATPKENCQNRRHYFGTENPSCKLDPKHHSDIIELIEDGVTYREIGEIFGISKSQIGNIAKKHIDPDRVDRVKALGNAIVPQVAMIPLQRVKELAQCT